MAFSTYHLLDALFVLALFGIIPALMAQIKGRRTFRWWLFGFVLPIVAIPTIFLAEDLSGKKCSQCAERIRRGAVRCRYCGYEYRSLHDDWQIY
jgi:hypothetical protein